MNFLVIIHMFEALHETYINTPMRTEEHEHEHEQEL